MVVICSEWLMLLQLLLVFLQVEGQQPSPGDNLVDDVCLYCICQTLSSCNERIGCVSGSCGIFKITEPYWKDAGSPQKDDEVDDVAAFQHCALDPRCAARAVRSYMKRYNKKCTNDEKIDCFDFVKIHVVGPSCNGTLNSLHSQLFEKCMDETAKHIPGEKDLPWLKSKPASQAVPIAVSVSVLFGIIVFAGGTTVVVRRRRRIAVTGKLEAKPSLTAQVSTSSQNSYVGMKNPTKSGEGDYLPMDGNWEFPRKRLRLLGVLGEGCFGLVRRAEAVGIDGTEAKLTVAVKTLKSDAGERELKDLLQELVVMKSLGPHPNIVKMLGCCTTKGAPPYLIMEFVTPGKLQSLLRSIRIREDYGKSKTLTSTDLTSFMCQIAKGMAFLSSKGIVHRDLAARNVLVNQDGTCKVADFGFARDLTGNQVYERKSDGSLPIRWMPPEAIYDDVFSVWSDVWSYGVLMWEIVTLGSTPYPGMGSADVIRHVREGLRLEKPEHCSRELYNIMFYCWHRDPAERPPFAELVDRIEELRDSEYVDLDAFPDHSYYNMASLSWEKL